MLLNWKCFKDRKASGKAGERAAAVYGSTRDRGARGEDIARAFLKKQGFKIRDVNYQVHGGEIDIIAMERGTLVFVEVKASASNIFADPLTWIPQWKQDRLVKASAVYIKAHRMGDMPLRYDVVTVDAGGRVQHIRDAFRPRQNLFM